MQQKNVAINENTYIVDSSNDITDQGRSEGTSSVAFELLAIKCRLEFMNLFIFNCLTSNFCFPKHISFARQMTTTVYERALLVMDFKLTRENDDLLSSRHR